MLLRINYPEVLSDLFGTDTIPYFVETYPSIDVMEDDRQTVILAEVPGVKKEDVQIKFENDTLTISGKRELAKFSENTEVLYSEIPAREFSRAIQIFHPVDVNKISAELENGILKVVLPKSEAAIPRMIEIK